MTSDLWACWSRLGSPSKLSFLGAKKEFFILYWSVVSGKQQSDSVMYVCMCVCIYICICVCVCIYVCVCVYVYMYVCVCICVYIHRHVCVSVCVCVYESLSHVQLFATPWTVAHQAPLSLEFYRQEYWSGLPFPSTEDLPDPGIKPMSPALQADSLPSESPRKPIYKNTYLFFFILFSQLGCNRILSRVPYAIL